MGKLHGQDTGQRRCYRLGDCYCVSYTQNPLGSRTTFSYDLASRLRRAVDPRGSVVTTLYDAASRAVVSIDPLGNRTTTVYNAAGQTVSLIDPNSRRNSFSYDANGRQTVEIDPLARRTTHTYDAAGRETYDAVGRMIAQASQRVTSNYDTAGFAHERCGRAYIREVLSERNTQPALNR